LRQDAIVFVDSSIQIARVLREPQMKARVNARLSQYRLKVTGSVALQEFKRRVLRTAFYLLTKLNKTNSYQDTLEYVTNVLPTLQQRKKYICQLVLHHVLRDASDLELTERARLYIRTLLVYGESQFIGGLDTVLPGVECYWARIPVREKKRYITYEIGEEKCSKSQKQCRVGIVLQTKMATCKRLIEFLNSLPQERMTKELTSARDFLERIIEGDALLNIHDEESCYKMGDLLLALESEGVPDFYTMNYKESQAFCDLLNQDLTIRPNNPDHEERTYLQPDKPWPNPSQ
jgi:hypothetical protein